MPRGVYKRSRIDPIIRFWAKVQKVESGCWLWLAQHNKRGYSVFALHHGHPFFAHRYSYQLHKGQIPQHLQLDHLCRNRGCVNPDHLEPVTGRENLRRGINTNRSKTHCIKGHPYDLANTYFRLNGQRGCRRCKALWMNKVYHNNPRKYNNEREQRKARARARKEKHP